MKIRFALIASIVGSLFGLQGLCLAGSSTTIATFGQSSVTIKGTVGNATSTTVHLFDQYSPPLTINSINITGTHADEYITGGTCVAGAVVQKIAPCDLVITCTPRATGTRNATLTATFANAASKTLALNGQ